MNLDINNNFWYLIIFVDQLKILGHNKCRIDSGEKDSRIEYGSIVPAIPSYTTYYVSHCFVVNVG